jgi:uncharacterized membrane protein YbhN (UPF0104 family)
MEFFKKYGKYLIYFVNMLLFVVLVGYAVKYYDVIREALLTATVSYLIWAFLVLLLVLFICALKWFVLMKIFNKNASLKNMFTVYLTSNLYKYAPPKGVNYIMRYKFMKDLKEGLHGKISIMFAEFFSELYIAGFFFLALLMVFLDYNKWATVFVVFVVLCMTLFMVYPKVFRIVPVRKFRKLVSQFRKIRKTKAFFFSLVMVLLTALLHGLVFYLILLAYGVSLPLVIVMLLFYGSQFFVFLFFAPAGIGVRDITIVGILVFFSVEPGLAITLSLTHRALMLLSEVVGGLPWFGFLKKN